MLKYNTLHYIMEATALYEYVSAHAKRRPVVYRMEPPCDPLQI